MSSSFGSYLWSWGGSKASASGENSDENIINNRESSLKEENGDGDDEAATLSTENEDEIADKLLSQFPPYGTNKKNPLWAMEDDEDEGTMATTNDNDVFYDARDDTMMLMKMSEPRKQHEKRKRRNAGNNEHSTTATKSSLSWDPKEEQLWKSPQDVVVVGSKPLPPSQPAWRFQQLSRGGVSVAQDTRPNPQDVIDEDEAVLIHTKKQKDEEGSDDDNGDEDDDANDNDDNRASLRALEAKDDDRQHWMPDRLCKQCYSCDLPFTVFRRRHHCRLCGQVFCSNCSAYFVAEPTAASTEDSTTKTKKATVGKSRACELCYDTVQRQKEQREKQLQQQQQQANEAPSSNTSSPTSMNRDAGAARNNAKNPPFKPSHHAQKDQLLLEEYLMPPSALLDKQQQHLHAQQFYPTPCDARETALVAASHTKFHVDQAIGKAAANHLRRVGERLLQLEAPLLYKSLDPSSSAKQSWINTLMTLATKCCSTVEPNVQKGDLLDIRPYVKLKTIPGGAVQDCAYLSGVVFRKQVAHKKMAREVRNPKLLLLSGGIEFTRTENRIASLETLLEQEEKYMEIMVGKILKLQPDLVLVGRSVSRKAQELLLQANVVLLQHVKPHLLKRIARQTGATILTSTDHVMNQFGIHVLGKCHRFRTVTFRDNELWTDDMAETTAYLFDEEHDSADAVAPGTTRKSIPALLQETDLVHHERQAALAASKLGEAVLDGTEAIKRGLAKRGVAQSYVLLEGCPKRLGCTVVLRGATRDALKQVKRVFRLLVNVAYNLRLETSYLRERCARLPSFTEESRHLQSSSLCVDYGQPAQGRKARPWNGASNNNNKLQESSTSGQITAFDHQSILITSVWMTEKNQCCPAEVKGICYYSLQDVSLGHFLRDSCFNLSLKCQNPSCKKSVLDHSLSFVHNDGLINITVEHMEDPLPPAPLDGGNDKSKVHNEGDDAPIATWTYCLHCQKVVTPLVYLSDDTWKFSFGKFLEVCFYNRDVRMNCGCNLQSSSVLYFGCGRLAARFTHEPVRPFGVFVRRCLAVDPSFHRNESLRQLENISIGSSMLFVKFDKHIEKVSREARSLFGSAANRPEHLQTVLSELNLIGSEVDHAAKTLQEKIATVSDKCRSMDVVNDALFRFPSYCRRYMFMLTSAWNERLSAAGQALAAMRKLASSSTPSGMTMMHAAAATRSESTNSSLSNSSHHHNNAIMLDGGSSSTEDLMEGMRRLRMLSEYYSNITDISTAMMHPSPSMLAPQRQLQDHSPYDDDLEDGHDDFPSEGGVDADVLASRRRLQQQQSHSKPGRPRKTLGTPRSDLVSNAGSSTDASHKRNVTAGGAVKSALTRFFNRGGKESDPYVVDLGILKDGRPRLEPGVDGVVLPVVDDMPSTVIAYSLSSAEYAKQFHMFSQQGAALDANPVAPVAESTKGEHARSDEPPPLLPETGPPPRPVQQSPPSTMETKKPAIPRKAPPRPSTSERQKSTSSTSRMEERKEMERRMLERNKSHIKHTFRDYDEKGQQTCKFVCTTYWATQFHVVREAFLSSPVSRTASQEPLDEMSQHSSQSNSDRSGLDVEKCYVHSLSSAYSWAASGGKSGASFQRTADDRFVIKCISRTELQMFLDCAPAYFEYLSKAFFHGL